MDVNGKVVTRFNSRRTANEMKMKPLQFEMPIRLHRRAMHKVQKYGVALAPYLRMATEQFVERPIAESMEILDDHNKHMEIKTKNRRRKK